MPNDTRLPSAADFVDPDRDLNDFSNGERLAEQVSATGEAYYVPGRGWIRWNGFVYAPADDWIMGEAAIAARKLFLQAAAVADEKFRIPILKHANASLRFERLQAAIKIAASIGGIKLHPRYCDASPFLLGVQNGIVDLREGDFAFEWKHGNGKPFAPDIVTMQAGTGFVPEAECSRWEQFLEEVFDGDSELIKYVQRAVGYILSGYTSEHVFSFLYGGGANGKSVFVNVLKLLLGDYAAVIASESVLAQKFNAQSYDLARLPGKRAVFATELDDGSRWNEPLVKNATGGEVISARAPYRESIEFAPVFKLVVSGNHKPVVRGTDEGMWRRLQLIPFRVFFPPEKRDRELLDKIREELPGILNWAIEGYAMWQADGLSPPAGVVDATAAYRSDEDRVGQFLAERCGRNEQLSIQAARLYRAYHHWSEARGEIPFSMTRFSGRLAEHGIRKVKNGSMFYLGIHLLNSDDAAKPSKSPEGFGNFPEAS